MYKKNRQIEGISELLSSNVTKLLRFFSCTKVIGTPGMDVLSVEEYAYSCCGARIIPPHVQLTFKIFGKRSIANSSHI